MAGLSVLTLICQLKTDGFFVQHSVDQGWVQRELGFCVDTIFASYNRQNARLLMEYIDRVRSPDFATCLVTEPPTEPKDSVLEGAPALYENLFPECCETPWITKYIMAVLIGVRDGSIDTDGLRVRFLSLSVEFLNRCGVAYSPQLGVMRKEWDHVKVFLDANRPDVQAALAIHSRHKALASIAPVIASYVGSLKQDHEITNPFVDVSGLLSASRYSITMEGLAKRFAELSKFTPTPFEAEELRFWAKDPSLTQRILKVCVCLVFCIALVERYICLSLTHAIFRPLESRTGWSGFLWISTRSRPSLQPHPTSSPCSTSTGSPFLSLSRMQSISSTSAA